MRILAAGHVQVVLRDSSGATFTPAQSASLLLAYWVEGIIVVLCSKGLDGKVGSNENNKEVNKEARAQETNDRTEGRGLKPFIATGYI